MHFEEGQSRGESFIHNNWKAGKRRRSCDRQRMNPYFRSTTMNRQYTFLAVLRGNGVIGLCRPQNAEVGGSIRYAGTTIFEVLEI